MSRQSSPNQTSSIPASSPIAQQDPSGGGAGGGGGGDTPPDPSSSSQPPSHRRRMSKDSEGYPSWLPRRPPPPAPESVAESNTNGNTSQPPTFVAGRKPTPRSVRIVSLQESSYGGDKAPTRREATDQTRVEHPSTHHHHRDHRVWSRAAGASIPPALFSSGIGGGGIGTLDYYSAAAAAGPQPRFRSTAINFDLLRNPSILSRIYFYIYPILVFAHIPIQTFLDFNAVFMLVQVSKFPTPQAPGIPGSGKNWALGAAAYIACWFAWILIVFILYEVVYSFIRRWRLKRPLVLPIYLSSSAFNLACMTSYSHFCFLQHIRYTALVGFGTDTSDSGSSSGGGASPSAESSKDDIPVIGEKTEEKKRPVTTSESAAAAAAARGLETGKGAGKGKGVGGSPRDFLAESFWFYSQNLPTVALLLPRAGLALALLLEFSFPLLPGTTTPGAGAVGGGFASSVTRRRDGTFFNQGTGQGGAGGGGTMLTGYAKGVLWVNVAWTGWRVCLLLVSWIGLWILSGQGCAGLCGPRDRWEEERGEKEREKRRSVRGRLSGYYYPGSANPRRISGDLGEEAEEGEGDADGDGDDASFTLPWSWRECTRMRVQEVYEFCLVGMSSLRRGSGGRSGGRGSSGGKEKPTHHHRHRQTQEQEEEEGQITFEGVEQVLAAVGFPSVPPPARRGLLSDELFETPPTTVMGMKKGGGGGGLEGVIPQVARRDSRERVAGVGAGVAPVPAAATATAAGPSSAVGPYPFTVPGSRMSSKDMVPFPPSPSRRGGSRKSASRSGSGGSAEAEEDDEEEEEEEEDDDDEDEEEEEDDEEEEEEEESIEPSSGRASGSLSSLGQPIPSRYPFQLRRPGTNSGSGRGNSMSSGAPSSSHMTRSMHSSRFSQGTHSTGNMRRGGGRESMDSSQSPQSIQSRIVTSSEDDAHGGGGSISGFSASVSGGGSSPIPMPPRHPQQRQGRRGRQRAGTVPVPVASPAVAFPRTMVNTTTTTGAGAATTSPRPRAQTQEFEPLSVPSTRIDPDASLDMQDDNHSFLQVGPSDHDDASSSASSHEAAERDDVVGLLSSAAPSPRTSLLRNRGSSLSLHRALHGAGGSRSGSNSRTNSHSGSSSASRSRTGSSISVSGAAAAASASAAAVRSRAQSLMQNIGAASHSSIELVVATATSRSRANSSMARLEDDYYSSDNRTHSRSGSGSVSANENYTFGRPMPRMQLPPRGREQEEMVEEEQRGSSSPVLASGGSSARPSEEVVRPVLSLTPPPPSSPPPVAASNPIEIPSHRNTSRTDVAVDPVSAGDSGRGNSSSPPDISTAAQSFVTAPATLESTTESSGGRTVSSWGEMSHMVDRSDGTWRPA